jgi:hypothetical protein
MQETVAASHNWHNSHNWHTCSHNWLTAAITGFDQCRLLVDSGLKSGWVARRHQPMAPDTHDSGCYHR